MSDVAGMIELKPCPFCGSEPAKAHSAIPREYACRIQCQACGAEKTGYDPWSPKDAEKSAVIKWNSRPPEAYLSARAEAAEAKLAKAEEALKPFAIEAAEWSASVADDFVPVLTPGVSDPGDDERAMFTVGDLRRARDIVSPMPNKEG